VSNLRDQQLRFGGNGGFSRRDLLRYAGLGTAAVASVPLLSACGSSSSSTKPASSTSSKAITKLSMQLSWVEDSSFSPLYIADSRGYFADQGVSLKLTPGGSDIGAIEGIVAGGSADVGIASDITTVIAAIGDGNPLVCIGAFYQSNLNVMMSDPKNPLTTVKQLVGKKLGGPQGTQTKFDAMFKLAGLKPDYKFVPTGYGPGSLIDGQVDALAGYLTDEVLAYKAAKGVLPGLLTFTDAGLPAYTQPIFVTTQTLKDKRDALKGMLGAIQKAIAVDVADPTIGATLAVTKYGKNADLVLASEKEHGAAYAKYFTSDATKAHGYLWVDPDEIAGPIFRGMKASGLKVPSDPSTVIDTSLLKELA
jgi:ABC-type nitrate/sulfonate/bicarbonate transport system substrate-binding protein